MHKSLHKFKFQPDRTTDYGVSFPWMSKTFPIDLYRSVRVAERLALPTSDHGVAGSNPAGGEILPEPKRRFIAQSLSCSPFHRLEMTEILLKGRKTLTHQSIHRLIMGKCCLHASLLIFDWIIINVAGNQDRHKSLDEFDFRPDQTSHFGVTCPWMTNILHFRTWISLKPVGQSWLNYMCSITGDGGKAA